MTFAPTSSLGVAFERVEKRYGGLMALRRVTLTIGSGEFVALLGPNGSGKTTLLRMAALLLQPSAGRVRHLGAENLAPEAVRSQIGLVAHKALVYDELTARENLSFFARLYGLASPAESVERVLGEVGLADRAEDAAVTFSRGMRQRLAIARALITEPGLLLFDEPATGLDREGRQWLDRTLVGLHRAGATLIVSTHDESLAALAGRSIWLRAGRLVRDSGAPAPLLVREVPG
ncbi:MAG TPA: ABC transporter ATP-binding protein [Patescibacteria group bacterium]|nr:ABC transporter ATP-binding protein [Patescibacteria group bacterium]